MLYWWDTFIRSRSTNRTQSISEGLNTTSNIMEEDCLKIFIRS